MNTIHNNPTFGVIIPAAGSSRRMGGKNKLLIDLDGKPVIIRTVDLFLNCSGISEVILVTNEEFFEFFNQFLKNNNIYRVIKLTKGGDERQYSVYNGLKQAKSDYVAVHDGARPLLPPLLLEKLLERVVGSEGVIPVIPVTDTIKAVDKDGFVIKTPPRKSLYRVQTPQVFPRKILLEAYEKAITNQLTITDESSAVELLGYRVTTVEGSTENIKLTTPMDIETAKIILKGRKKQAPVRSGKGSENNVQKTGKEIQGQ